MKQTISDKTAFVKNNKARYTLAFFVFSFLIAACFSQNEQSHLAPKDVERAYVTKIKDGDSLILRGVDKKEFEARLFGIDAPELNQPFGKEAKRNLTKLAFKKNFTVVTKGTDKYQRSIVILLFDNRSLNEDMIANGNAWVYRQYQSNPKWIKLESEAKRTKKGLWRFPRPIAPWEWRRKK